MFDYYKLDIIPIILNRFKVDNIIISGTSDEKTINHVLKYCEDNSASYITIDPNDINATVIDNTLNVLPNLTNYDAIFLNDDPNWYTVYNELNIIKQKNSEFPLVFILHNTFPHKRRDTYNNPDIIPEKFINDYSQDFYYKDIFIEDGLFHAIDENTPRNGVLTAIEDFLSENKSIGLMNIKLSNGITILYPENSISQIRLSRLSEEIEGYDLDYDNFTDSISENQILTKYLSGLNISKSASDTIKDFKTEIDEKEKIINDYENKIKLHDTELSYKNSQIKGFDSRLNLKDSQIKNFESILLNTENEINTLNSQLTSMKNTIQQKEKRESELNNQLNAAKNQIKDNVDQVNSLKNTIQQKEKRESELNNQLNAAKNQIKDNFDQINHKNSNIHFKENQVLEKEKELKNKEILYDSLKQQYINKLAKLDTKEYCISCYQEEINNNNLEIHYLKKETLMKKLINPFAYLLLILKSNGKELSLNLKLYKALKKSKCFDVGYYLNNNADIIDSKWCKYFSPELHYVCNGFEENRRFNKKYFNRNSKKELLDYIYKCQ